MKKIIFITVVAALFSITALAHERNNEPFLTQKFAISSISKIDVATSVGRIEVNGDATNEAEVKVFIRAINSKKKKNISKEEIEELLNENYSLEIKVENGTLYAIAKETKSNNKKGLSISFEISVASKVDGQVKTGVGSIQVQNIQGKIKGNSGTGSVKVEKCDGDINLKTGVGSISLNDLKGTAEISSGSGSIKAEDISANLTVKTSVGSMQFKNISGSLKANSGTGSIKLYNVQSGADIRTGTGGITVEKCQGNFDLKTSSGGVKLENITGNIVASTNIGSLKMENLIGEIKATTGSGSVTADNITGSLITKTSVGSLTVKNFSGNLDAQTGTGNSTIAMTNISEYFRLTSTSVGNIKVVLPKDKGYDLNVKGGKIRSLQNFKGDYETGNVKGQISGGGAEVTINAPSNQNVQLSFE